MENRSSDHGSLYKPLNTIRLLRLPWGKEPSKFDGCLESFALNSPSCPEFMVLSYVWGSPTPSKTINLNGHKFNVLNNLYSFLELTANVPEFGPDTWWWIDAICINQDDEREKCSQIQIMGNIYEKAERTIVWLGEEYDQCCEEDSKDCRGAIKSLRRLKLKRWEFTRNDNSLDQAKFLELRKPESGIDWKAIERLLSRPWWRRVWTLQEFLIGADLTFYCGRDDISRSDFQVAMYALYNARGGDGKLMSKRAYTAGWNRRRINQWYEKRKGEMSLVAMMAYEGDCGATDERDRVYSLLGIAKDADIIGSIDFDSSVDTVYTKLVQSFIKKYNSLDIICLAHLFNHYAQRSNTGTSLPSWIPDWRAHLECGAVPVMASQGSRSYIANFRPFWIEESEARYAASGNSEPRISIPWDPRVLTCEGIILDEIDGLSGSRYNDSGALSKGQEDNHIPSIQSTSEPNCSTGLESLLDIAVLDTILRCLLLDREDRYLCTRLALDSFRTDFKYILSAAVHFPNILYATHSIFIDWFQLNRLLRMQGHTLEEHCQALEVPKIIDVNNLSKKGGFLDRFRDTTVTMARRLTVTRNGNMGMAPSRARKGDLICVLFGCSIPVVLRRQHMGYEFVGECYLDGYMNGEGLSKDQGTIGMQFRLL